MHSLSHSATCPFIHPPIHPSPQTIPSPPNPPNHPNKPKFPPPPRNLCIHPLNSRLPVNSLTPTIDPPRLLDSSLLQLHRLTLTSRPQSSTAPRAPPPLPRGALQTPRPAVGVPHPPPVSRPTGSKPASRDSSLSRKQPTRRRRSGCMLLTFPWYLDLRAQHDGFHERVKGIGMMGRYFQDPSPILLHSILPHYLQFFCSVSR